MADMVADMDKVADMDVDTILTRIHNFASNANGANWQQDLRLMQMAPQFGERVGQGGQAQTFST